MKIVLLFSVALLAFGGCATLPQGWDQADPEGTYKVSCFLREVIDGQVSIEPVEQQCIISSGIAGGVNFWLSRNSTKDLKTRLLDSVTASEKYAEKYYPSLCEKHGGLSGVVLSVMNNNSVEYANSVNTSQILLALLNTVISNNMLGNHVDFSKKDLEEVSCLRHSFYLTSQEKTGIM